MRRLVAILFSFEVVALQEAAHQVPGPDSQQQVPIRRSHWNWEASCLSVSAIIRRQRN